MNIKYEYMILCMHVSCFNDKMLGIYVMDCNIVLFSCKDVPARRWSRSGQRKSSFLSH